MNMKLTLSMDDRIIEMAKRYSKSHQVSLSGLIANYLKGLTSKGNEISKASLSPEIRKLWGGVCISDKSMDYKTSLAGALKKKYR